MDEKQLKRKSRGKPFSPGVSGNPAGRPVKEKSFADNWEYRVLNISSNPDELERELNNYGAWDLVCCEPKSNNNWVLAVFKRQLS
ncbi:MAG: hypothetical protein L6277_10495 [Desulfobacterales bacterium]|nr:hypothetical protein [Pseudomonadota bacterium]MCG2772502.1 hypothetical protein [Desulfobacterales bacterium]